TALLASLRIRKALLSLLPFEQKRLRDQIAVRSIQSKVRYKARVEAPQLCSNNKNFRDADSSTKARESDSSESFRAAQFRNQSESEREQEEQSLRLRTRFEAVWRD